MAQEYLESSHLGGAARKPRSATGMLQKELTNRFAHNRSYVGGVEEGEGNSTLKITENAAQSFSIRPAELLSYSAKELQA